MSAEENKRLVRETFAAMDAARSMEPLTQYAAADYICHFAGFPHDLDRAGMAEVGNAFYGAFSDLRHALDAVIAEGDLVATRLTLTGTHTGPFHTPAGVIDPTGRSVRFVAQNFFRLRDGKAVEHWIVADFAGLMGQLSG